jgi:hypothetical protein
VIEYPDVKELVYCRLPNRELNKGCMFLFVRVAPGSCYTYMRVLFYPSQTAFQSLEKTSSGFLIKSDSPYKVAAGGSFFRKTELTN